MASPGKTLLDTVLGFFFLAWPCAAGADSSATSDLAQKLTALDARVIADGKEKSKELARMLARDVQGRRRAANERSSAAWEKITSKKDWEKFRARRLAALRASLAGYPPAAKDLQARVTRRLEGDGFRIENLVFESRPGVLVTANLYVPAKAPASMPGILICHSHHNPKTQGELQDMGMTWARLGCLVLVMDQLGHGERRQHPFKDASAYPHRFRVSRQDYYFRYNVGMQLSLIGDSLIGWLAWDLMRGVDLLLARPGIDKKRIILLGAVAGGGDPVAVTGALDPRIAAVVPFNFGGPQPESGYPLPVNAGQAFNYAGSGSWESTRNLRLSARDGFLPWVIVGAIAPRRLIYAHEFSWDRERDPVWARLGKIYGFYGAADRLASVHGRGKVTGKPPESTHCNNIGPVHRRQIYPALKSWFQMPEPETEYRRHRPADELICLTPEALRQVTPRPLYKLAADLASTRVAAARERRAALTAAERRAQLQKEWTGVLGEVEAAMPPRVTSSSSERMGTVTVERLVLTVERDIVVPCILLLPALKGEEKLPAVVGVAQGGKQGFLKHRPEFIASLLHERIAVCLPDLRGIGETSPGDGRGRSSAATALSSSEQMLGQTLVGSRLKDLRAVLHVLRGHKALDKNRIGLWGDSFAPVNPPEARLAVPMDADEQPSVSEPLGELLALLGGLYDDKIRAIAARGGLAGYRQILDSPFCYLPHDVVVPGALTTGDLCDVAAALAPRPLRLEALVNGLNQTVAAADLATIFEPARAAYRSEKAQDRAILGVENPRAQELARWFRNSLK
jgi:cephalosporin-C deacetylase-like acetyl esterase